MSCGFTTIDSGGVFRACSLMFGLVLCSVVASGSEKKVRLTIEQSNEVRTLLREFAGKKTTSDIRAGIVEKLLSYPWPSAAKLLPVLDKQIASMLRSYEKELPEEATAVFRKRKRSLEEEGLSTHLPERRKIFLVDVKEVLSASEKVRELREKLFEFEAYQKRCLQLLPEEEKKKRDSKGKRGKKRKGKKSSAQSGTSISLPQRTFAERLRLFEMLVGILPAAENKRYRSILEANRELEDQIPIIEAEGILDLNIIRILTCRHPLGIDVRLCAAAKDHSDDMRAKGFFSHVSPVPGKKTHSDRGRNFGTSCTHENIAVSPGNGIQANIVWMNSPGHRANMLNTSLKYVGLGQSGKFWTQMFR